ncbi:MAG: hypothetical protein IPL59_25860 [Candidatus Competibacteraceae bacterium]|uniref:Uncharacterized protein n=1 Tax=Candidatus Contendobacter odensis Run_B_J11 TaxID=1400861 RepID=A0A7U7J3U3_9GAMM|nr:DUF6516 family protein [Candidatus Contendobacter odensis]MBK8538212.1 hypothetical protein [Candidatus Competibacteraceae bacterium]MBK8752757.1 hypothetical protein [Candidatus Competibacteraceae bacterium]CDH44694.1 conserved hypothetical protein [Candidatus Contendobacter odensis Run_B_J11]
MKAQPLFNRRIQIDETAFVELVTWTLPHAVPGSVHRYKYRMALVVRGVCVLRYDNESGKGDHRHWGEQETPYAFTDIDRLVADFLNDVTRWRNEHSDL